MIAANLNIIYRRMAMACQRAGRHVDEVRLLLATKTVSAENIRIALETGTTLLGENKVQELKQKFEALKDIPHQTHFIGHLQTNKIKDVLHYADCIQSVDRPELIEKLDQRLQAEGRAIDIFIQVNTSGEESKFGVSPEKAVALASLASRYGTLRVKGLMTIGLFSKDEIGVRRCYQKLREVQKGLFGLSVANITPGELSMGMSGDLEIAIEEGATMIRVGTAIFGQRIYADSYYWNEEK